MDRDLIVKSDGEMFVISLDDAEAAAEAGCRVECAWCWEDRNPGMPFPEEATSTICAECQERFFS